MYLFADKLKEYAQLLVRVGVNVQQGQDVVITSQVFYRPQSEIFYLFCHKFPNFIRLPVAFR